MEKEKTENQAKRLTPLNADQLSQVSFMYSTLESYPLINPKADSDSLNLKNKSQSYPVFEHHKPISKILDIKFLHVETE